MSNNGDVNYDGTSYYFTFEQARTVADIEANNKVALGFTSAEFAPTSGDRPRQSENKRGPHEKMLIVSGTSLACWMKALSPSWRRVPRTTPTISRFL
jgi:hypothetical protein